MGGGNYNVGYQQNPQLPQTPTGGWNYNNAGYQQNPQPLQTLMEGGNYNNNAGYQAPGQHEVQQDYEREQRPNPNRHRVRGLRPDPSQARDGKRDFNNYNSDHQNAGRESAHQFRSPAYRQRAENRGRRRYHESQSHHNAPPPTGAHPSPAPSENTGGTGPTQAQIDALMQQVNELREQLNSTRRDVVEQKSRHETTEGTVGEAVNHLRGISNNDSNTPPYPLKQEMDDVHVDLMAIEPIVNTSLPNEDSQAFLILPNVAAQNEPANADNQNPMFNFRANSEAPSTNFSDTPSSTALVEPKSYGKTPGDKSGGRKRRKQ
jgi:hypothetical protein